MYYKVPKKKQSRTHEPWEFVSFNLCTTSLLNCRKTTIYRNTLQVVSESEWGGWKKGWEINRVVGLSWLLYSGDPKLEVELESKLQDCNGGNFTFKVCLKAERMLSLNPDWRRGSVRSRAVVLIHDTWIVRTGSQTHSIFSWWVKQTATHDHCW